jgi:O-acetyl-ADP-ribose deacetylase (regulator of RNase III)
MKPLTGNEPASVGPQTAGPLRAVLDAVRGGAGWPAAVEAATGLEKDVVRTALEHLQRMGRVDIETVSFGCPTGGCGTCPVVGADGRACKTATNSAGPRGLTFVILRAQ